MNPLFRVFQFLEIGLEVVNYAPNEKYIYHDNDEVDVNISIMCSHYVLHIVALLLIQTIKIRETVIDSKNSATKVIHPLEIVYFLIIS